MSFKDILLEELDALGDAFRVCGFVDQSSRIYPLGSDTKVLSTIFELVSRPAIYKVAEQLGLSVVEPSVQNHYPDFTLMENKTDNRKIAIDVKTTYRSSNGTFGFTLGGYTSFIRKGNEGKNIVFPFNHYESHWVIGFVYDRVAQKKSSEEMVFNFDELHSIPLAFESVEYFVQEKWRIASGTAGSGNTTNIGSIVGDINSFREGNGPFRSEEEFLEYWRGYGRTASERERSYSSLHEFRRLNKR